MARNFLMTRRFGVGENATRPSVDTLSSRGDILLMLNDNICVIQRRYVFMEASNYGVIRSLIEMHAGIPYGEIGWHIAAACTQSHLCKISAPASREVAQYLIISAVHAIPLLRACCGARRTLRTVAIRRWCPSESLALEPPRTADDSSRRLT
jgi:hypothetical protein